MIPFKSVLSLLFLAVTLLACSSKPPAISERQLQQVNDLEAMQKLYNSALRKAQNLSGGARRISFSRLKQLGERIADKHLMALEREFAQDRQSYSALVSLKNIAQYERILKRIRPYKAAVTEVMSQLLEKERATTESFLGFFLEGFDETDEKQLPELRRAKLVSHSSFDKHAQLTNLYGEMQLNLLLNAQQALENGAYNQAILYAEQARILDDNEDVQTIVDRAETGLFNLDLKEPLKAGQFEEAIAMLDSFKRRANFEKLRPYITRDVLQISAHYSKKAEIALKRKKYVDAYRALRVVSDTNALVDRDMFNESFQISFLERLYNVSRRAAQKNRSGFELGLLEAIYSLDAQYPGIEENLAFARKRVLQQAQGQIAVLPFRGQKGSEALADVVARQLAGQLTQTLGGTYQAVFVDDLENLREARLALDYYAVGEIKSREINIDKSNGTSYENIELAFSLMDAKTETLFLQDTLRARRPLENRVTPVASSETRTLNLNPAELGSQESPLIKDLTVGIAQQIQAKIKSPFQNYVQTTLVRSDVGRELEAIESMAALAVLGEDREANKQWRESLVESAIKQMRRLNLH